MRNKLQTTQQSLKAARYKISKEIDYLSNGGGKSLLYPFFPML